MSHGKRGSSIVVAGSSHIHDVAPIIRQGYLQKQGGFIKSWKNRFFVLQKGQLTYWENEQAVRTDRGRQKDTHQHMGDFMLHRTLLHAYTCMDIDVHIYVITKS